MCAHANIYRIKQRWKIETSQYNERRHLKHILFCCLLVFFFFFPAEKVEFNYQAFIFNRAVAF